MGLWLKFYATSATLHIRVYSVVLQGNKASSGAPGWAGEVKYRDELRDGLHPFAKARQNRLL